MAAPAPTALQLIEALEALPLLGHGLERATALRGQLTKQLAQRPQPELQLRSQLHLGELLLERGSPDAGTFLRELAEHCDQRRAPLLAARARLLAVRALRRIGDLESARAQQALSGAALEARPELRAEVLLAQAWLGDLEAVALLEEALERLPPERDHQRLAALLELADRCEDGGDPYRARRALERALELAQQHRASGPAGRAALLLGSLLLRTGELEAARGALEEALDLGARAEDSLVQASAGLLVVALQLAEGAWEPLLATSAPLIAIAHSRHNPAMRASLALDRSSAQWALERPVEALVELMTATLELQAHPLPGQLIQARLAEILEEVGAERFTALVQQAAAVVRGGV